VQNFIVFDIDKTLYRGTLAMDFAKALCEEGCIASDLPEVQQFHSLRGSDNSPMRNEALISLLRAARESGTMQYSDYRRIGRKVGVRSISALHERPLKLLEEHVARTRIAISTSPYAVVKPFADQLGFDITIAPMPQVDGKVLGPKSVIGTNERTKGEWLQKLVDLYSLSWEESIGIGDSVTDVSFLELVKRPIAYEPDGELEAVATQKGWEIWGE
jgi:phosphoserine phosphatase